MTAAGCCASADRHFTADRARTELRRYRRRGPTGSARRILRMLSESQVRAETLLDIGAGIGVLHHELLALGGRSAVHLAEQLAPADLVTLDRVICCYPAAEALVRTTAAKARRYWAASFPRDRWITRGHTRWENARRARAENPFRTFVHLIPGIYALLQAGDLVPQRIHRGLFWEIVLCSRTRPQP